MNQTRSRRAAVVGLAVGVVLALAPQLPTFAIFGQPPVGGCSAPYLEDYSPPIIGDQSPPILGSLSSVSPPVSCPVTVKEAEPVGKASRPEGDFDADGVPDADDNCGDVPNEDQADGDADATGDLCDPSPGATAWFAQGAGWMSTWDAFAFRYGPDPRRNYITYTDGITGDRFETTHLVSLGGLFVINQTFVGSGEVNGRSVGYVLNVGDHGEPGTFDTFSLTWTYSSGLTAVGPFARAWTDAGWYNVSGSIAAGNIQVY